MRNISIFILMMLLVGLSTKTFGQSIEGVVEHLAERSMDGVHVRVLEDESTRSAVATVEAQRRVTEISGFRVVIFSDNGQYAGDNAQKVLKEFEAAFPHINAYLVYESPYFKISVGDCLSMEEAQILMAKVAHNYPKAFPKRESIKLENLHGARREYVAPRDSVSIELTAPQVVMFGK